ncbi:MAG: FxLYD domain-containing protein [Halobacteriota archaeon]
MRRRALLTTLGAVVPVGLAGCAQLSTGDEATPEQDESTATDETPDPESTTARRETSTATPPSVTLLEDELVRSNADTPEELVSVVGVARNDGDTALEDVTAVAQFLDADGEPFEPASAELDELDAGEQWEFSLVYPGSGEDARTVDDYRLRVRIEE